jgi:hypothetical protein
LGWNGTLRHFPPLDFGGRYRQASQVFILLSSSGIRSNSGQRTVGGS